MNDKKNSNIFNQLPSIGIALPEEGMHISEVLDNALSHGISYVEIRKPEEARLLTSHGQEQWFIAFKMPYDEKDDLINRVDAIIEAGELETIDLLLFDSIGETVITKNSEMQKTIQQLKESGKIRYFGVSVDTYPQLKDTLTKTPCDAVEVLFNVFFQEPSQLFSFVKAKRMPLIIKNPFDNGWLTGNISDRTGESETQKRELLIKKMKDIVGTDDLVTRSLGFIRAFDGVTTIVAPIHTKKVLQALSQTSKQEITYGQKNALVDLYNQQIKNQPFMK